MADEHVLSEDYRVRLYQETDEALWDDFVEHRAVNGTFLQTQRFLNYHPKNRFQDCSLMIEDKKGHIAAVCPACCIEGNAGKQFISHMGSTFGGVIISPKQYHAHKVIAIVQTLEEYLRRKEFDAVELRITPDLFSKESSALLEYVLFYCGYQEYSELSTYIDYETYKENILSNFEQGKRTNVHNCVKAGLHWHKIDTEKEIGQFYQVLCQNLKKFDAKPVHSLQELLDLKRNRLSEEIDFYGIFQAERMVAGSMMFYFRNVGVAHTQYLCADLALNTLSPMTYLYYAMIEEMKRQGFKKLSFGISTEDKGRILNYGLTRSKEAYGGGHCLNKKFCKML